MGRKLTIEEFIEKARLKHGDKFDYSLVEYKNAKTKVNIICPNNHVFEQSTDSHLRGRGCLICKGHNKSTEEFINKAIKKHGDKYDYSNSEYINSTTYIKISCKIHKEFTQRPSHHLRGIGCPKCAGKNKTTEDIIKEFKSIHGSKYDYSLVEYKKCDSKVKIICSEHGVFLQSPSDHLDNKGCKKCANELLRKIKRENPTGWTVTNWNNQSKKTKNFDSFKVYIIRCWNDTEQFYKIGRTFTSTNIRFNNKNLMPYNYEIINEFIFDTAKEAFCKEKELKRIHKKHKYIPKNKFDGMHECFHLIIQ